MSPPTSSRVFSLTGGIASGKSTVARFFTEAQIPVVDADELARKVVLPKSEGLARIEQEFGREMLRASGELNRKALGAAVFGHPARLQALNSILHPLIHRLGLETFYELQSAGHSLICYDIPLLFETRQEQNYRPVVVVYCKRTTQIQRAMQRDQLSAEEVEARINSQMPLEEKARRATFVLNNEGTLEELQAQALTALAKIRDLPAP